MAQYILVDDATDQEIEVGTIVKTFRGEECKLLGFTAPRHDGSTGRVLVEIGRNRMEYYPSVIGCKIVEVS